MGVGERAGWGGGGEGVKWEADSNPLFMDNLGGGTGEGHRQVFLCTLDKSKSYDLYVSSLETLRSQ